jgi:SAM-dependent methyltransferase
MNAPAPQQSFGIGPEEAERLVGTIAPWLPPSLVPLFDARATRSHALYDEFVFRLTLRTFRDSGLTAAVREWGSTEEILVRAGLDLGLGAVPVGWMLRHLAARSVLAREDGPAGPRFRAERALPDLDPEPLLAEQRRLDPACQPSYVLAEITARDYPTFLRGKRSGEEILLAPARLPLWMSYFSNDNVLYAVTNRVGAAAVEAWMPSGARGILELGGGLASGAVAVLERLASVGRLGEVRAYRFTELVPVFLRRGQRLLQERFPGASFLTYAPLDMNRPFAEQGVAPGCVSIVYAVNTLHVAHDLAFTLGEVRQALQPGGQIIISECIRPWPGDTLYPEFIFNLLASFRAPRLHPAYRPNGGFLTPEQWTEGLQATGFVDVRVLPDIARIREEFPAFYPAAIGARCAV